ncbi:MAG: SCO family protein [Bacteroidota bacterium]|nr:SCO family protein [Bacteroidota bacterium]
MNKTSIYALLIALLLPLSGYFIMKGLSERNLKPPRHYIYDSVQTAIVKGKHIIDTIWHCIPDFTLTNQLGKQVSWKDLENKTDKDGKLISEGKIVVADFFFTHCPTICPRLTKNMKRLQETIKNNQRVGDRDPDFIQFLSFSVDPERDSVAALKKWADRFQVNPFNWWLLTGDKKTIYDLSFNDMKLGLVDGEGIDSNFLHTDYMVLIDRYRNIRGYYHGLDTTELAKLSEDIIFLTLEKDPKRKSFFEGKIEMIAIVFLITLVLVGALLIIIRKKNPAADEAK